MTGEPLRNLASDPGWSIFVIEFVDEICFDIGKSLPPLSLPDDLASAHVALLAEREARLRAEAEVTSAKAKLSIIEALNAHLQLLIAKLERDKHGPSRERTQRLIDQKELQLEELVADATEDELA